MEDRSPKTKIVSINDSENSQVPVLPADFFDAVDYVIDQAEIDYSGSQAIHESDPSRNKLIQSSVLNEKTKNTSQSN